MTAGVAASASRAAYFYIPELTYGVTPSPSPAFKPLRLTSFGLTMQANEITSDELRPDRHRASTRRGQTSVAGDIVGELSYGTYDDLFAAVFCGTWAIGTPSTGIDQLKTGTVRTSFSILKRNLDVGIDTIYTGCEVNQLQLQCPLQEKITATFSIVGNSEAPYVVPVGSTFGTAGTTDFMTTFAGSLKIGGSTFAAGTDLSITLANNLAAKYSLFQSSAYGIKLGMIDVSGSLSAYIEDDTLKAAFRDETDEVLEVTMVDKASGGNSLYLKLPKSRFTTAQDNQNGDDYVVQQLNIRGLLDSGSATELLMQRDPA